MRHVKRRSKARSLTKSAELAIAAPLVIANRTARMLAAGTNPTIADRAEFSRMWTEKVEAFWESMFAMGAQTVRANQDYARVAALQWWRLCTTPWWLPKTGPAVKAMTRLPTAAAFARQSRAGRQTRELAKLVEAGLGPIHKRATANARRLAKTRGR